MRVDFNTSILNTLVYQYPEKGLLAKSRFPGLNEWMKEEDKPTMNQLASLAHFFQIPFGYFFLQELPERKYPIPHFRTVVNQSFKPSPDLHEVVETLRERQQWAKDILIELRETKLAYANSCTVRTPIVTSANEIRSILGVTETWARNATSWTQALGLLVEKTESAGIFVVMNGVVNNNNKRKLDVSEFRGFVLHDEFAPFVFINNNDAVSGKIFTLIHEIVHVLLGKSASFDLRQLQPAEDGVEKYCNAVAAEFLVPEAILQTELAKVGANYEQLARSFKVSQIVIARRLLDLKAISEETFFTFYDNHLRKELRQKVTTGGNFYNTVPYRISKRFFRVIYSAVTQNKMLYKDAFRLTNLKPKTFDQYIKRHIE